MGLQQHHMGPTPAPDVMPWKRKAEGKGRSPVDYDWAPEIPSVRQRHRLVETRAGVSFWGSVGGAVWGVPLPWRGAAGYNGADPSKGGVGCGE